MKFKKIFIICCFLMTILLLNTVCASDNVTSDLLNSDEMSSNQLFVNDSKDDSFENLADEINVAGDVLVLDKNYSHSSDSKDGILINKSITVDGKGYTLNANCNSRIFNIAADNVTLMNINFINGLGLGSYNNNDTIGGGAIYWTGTNGKLINCTFIDNAGRGLLYDPYAQVEEIIDEKNGISTIIDWPSMRPVGASTNYGGAIVWKGNNAFISNCVFTGNAVDYPNYGGAIFMTGENALIESSKFFNNSAWNGIAIYYYGKGLVINSSYINGTSSYGSDNDIGGVNYTVINPKGQNDIINGSFEDLENKINMAIGTIFLDKDYMYSANDKCSVLINKSITIDGKGHTLDGAGISRVFNITSDNVILKNIIFTRSACLDGGFIYGNCLVINCTFKGYLTSDELPIFSGEDNHAFISGGAMYGGTAINSTFINNRAGFGGAIYNGFGINCTFKNNRAAETVILHHMYSERYGGYGGAVYNTSCVNCTFEDNYARFGGAIYNGNATSSNFINNHADDYGGAICHGNIFNCIFESNIANYGGAASTVNVSNSTFYMNKADLGGAILGGNAINCTFDKNQAGFYRYEENYFGACGGAVYGVDVDKCIFKSNIAFNTGGAVFKGNVKNSIFINNTADEGGAVSPYNNNDNIYTADEIINSTFINNSAIYGGAVFGLRYYAENSIIKNCIFINNNASEGGAVYAATILNSNFTQNNASNDGGAVYNSFVFNSLFINNNAQNGGAVSDSEITNSTFINNKAINYGGAVYKSNITSDLIFKNNTANTGNDTYDVLIINDTNTNTFTDLYNLINTNQTEIYLTNNYTFDFKNDNDLVEGIIITHNLTIHGNNNIINGNNKARIFIISNATVTIENIIFICGKTTDNGGAVKGLATIINSLFINNTASGYGGAVDNVYCINSTFINNNARHGGAAYNSTILNSTFINNTAHDGGAIMYGTVYNTKFINNTAANFAGRGGAIYIGTVFNCTFEGNAADSGGAVSDVVVVNSTFINNIANNGGAMSGGEAINCTFIGNTAKYYLDQYFIGGRGGAIIHGLAVSSTFINNNAADSGGAIYAFELYVGFDNCNFINNTAISGGALYLIKSNSVNLNNTKCLLQNSNFTNNRASKYGGAIYVGAENVWIVNSKFDNNLADKGGDVYTNSTSVYIVNSNYKSVFNEQVIKNLTVGNDTNNNSFKELYGLINGAEDYLVLDKDYIYFTNDKGSVSINKTIIIDGQGHTIDAKNSSAIFFINADNVVLKNINFVNARSDYAGGAIAWIGDNASVINCTFTDCKSHTAGGSIALKGNNSKFINSSFINSYVNEGTWGLLAILDNFNPDLMYITVMASIGGAIYIDGSNASINNSIFINNSVAVPIEIRDTDNEILLASSDNDFMSCGGALYVDGENLVIADSLFKDNKASFGNDYFSSSETIIINSTFGVVEDGNSFKDLSQKINESTDLLVLDKDYKHSGNDTSGILINKTITIDGNGHTLDGNAMSRIFKIINGTVILRNINFVNASAVTGSAIFGRCLVINCTFVNNYCRNNYLPYDYYYENPEEYPLDTPILLIDSVSETDYMDDSMQYKYYHTCGGAMYQADAFNCTFINNSAYLGGAMSYGNAFNCTFINNSAYWGGVMFNCDSFNCTFVGNNAGEGGAMFYGSAFNCTFVDNNANYCGGAMYQVDAFNCTFVGNNASYGGAMYAKSAFNCAFVGNNASYGGAISFGSAVNCTFNNNHAIEKGNNIYGIYLHAYDFKSMINSGEKLFVYLENSPISITGKNITIKVYKDNNLVGTYYCLSGDGWIVDLDVGNYTAVLSLNDSIYYTDDANTTITIEKSPTKLSVTPVTEIYKDDKYLIVTLKDDANNPIIGTAISVNLNGVKNLITDSNGQVKVSTKDLTPKPYVATIMFAGNDNYTESTSTVNVIVKKVTPTLTASKKTFKVKTKSKKYAVTLKDNKNKAIKNAKITLKIKGKTYKATTNANGKVTFKITKLSKKGTFKAKISFTGDKYYNKVAKTVKISVKK